MNNQLVDDNTWLTWIKYACGVKKNGSYLSALWLKIPAIIKGYRPEKGELKNYAILIFIREITLQQKLENTPIQVTKSQLERFNDHWTFTKTGMSIVEDNVGVEHEDIVEKQDDLKKMMECIDKLHRRYRKVIEDKLAGIGFEEMVERYGTSRQNFENKYKRALKELRILMRVINV